MDKHIIMKPETDERDFTCIVFSILWEWKNGTWELCVQSTVTAHKTQCFIMVFHCLLRL